MAHHLIVGLLALVLGMSNTWVVPVPVGDPHAPQLPRVFIDTTMPVVKGLVASGTVGGHGVGP